MALANCFGAQAWNSRNGHDWIIIFNWRSCTKSGLGHEQIRFWMTWYWYAKFAWFCSCYLVVLYYITGLAFLRHYCYKEKTVKIVPMRFGRQPSRCFTRGAYFR